MAKCSNPRCKKRVGRKAVHTGKHVFCRPLCQSEFEYDNALDQQVNAKLETAGEFFHAPMNATTLRWWDR